jgi:hypothetical protein
VRRVRRLGSTARRYTETINFDEFLTSLASAKWGISPGCSNTERVQSIIIMCDIAG